MTPDPTQDHSGLRWIRGELDETLRQARLQLEDFVEEETDSLDDCVRHLHHVHGSLELVQVYGGAMLADELEKLARALASDKVDRPDAAAEVLMLGMVQLPSYLERIESGEPDIPLILLPLMNDIRASRRAPLVSEISLFAPKLDSVIAAEAVVLGSGNPALPELVKRERAHYHRGLLNWFRDVDAQQGLSQIRDVIETVSGEARTARMRRLLDSSEALVAALQSTSIESSVAVKRLFGQLDRCFKRIIDEGEEAAAREFPLELLKNQLYYIARSDSDDPVVQAVRQSADLANSFPDISTEDARSGQLGGPGKALFEAVGDALRSDLLAVKDQLDLYIRGARDDFARLGELVDPVRRIGDTLGMVGRGGLRSRLAPHCERLNTHVENETQPDDDQLMALAADLLFVESALSGLAEAPTEQESIEEIDSVDTPLLQAMSDGEFREHVQAAINQAFVELAKTKDAILQYLGKPDQPELLKGSPDYLHAVSGALTILEQPQAARLLENLRSYLGELARGEREQPNDEQREALADLVSGVEYHMESVVERKPDHRKALVMAEAASQRLGLGEPQLREVSAEEFSGDSADAKPEVAAEAPVPAAEKPALDDIDSEILDIFIEEAREELQAIRQHYPRWRDRTGNEDDLTRMRRAFHTLKGSGRLVGATQIGEFAWSVENLLNRVIDGTVYASHDVFSLLDEVVDTLPALIDERDQGGVAQTPVDKLQERAFLLASAPAKHVATEEVAASNESGPEPVADDDAEASLELEPVADETLLDAVADEPEPMPRSESDSGSELELKLDRESESDTTAGPKPGETGNAEAFSVPDVGDVAEVAEADIEVENLFVDDVAAVDPVADLDEAAGEDDPMAVLSLLDDLDLDDEPDEPTDAPQNLLEEAGPALDVENNSILDTDSLLQGLDLDDDLLPDSIVALDQDSAAPDSAAEETPPESILTPHPEKIAPIQLEAGLYDIFSSEAGSHLQIVEQFIEHCRGRVNGCEITAELKRALHTLRGSSHMAEVSSMASLAGAMENWVNLLSALERRTDVTSIDLLERGHFVLSSLLNVINQAGAAMPAWQPLQREFTRLVDSLNDEMAESVEVDESKQPEAELVDIFLEEAHELSEGLETDYANWRERADDLLPVAQLQRHLHTIKGGARMAGLAPIGDLAHAMESLFESLVERRIDGNRSHQQLARHALDALAGQVEVLRKGGMPPGREGIVERLEAAAHGRSWEPVETPVEEVAESFSGLLENPLEIPSDSFEMSSESLEIDSEPTDDSADQGSGEASTLLNESHLLTDSELLSDSHMSAASLLLHEGGDGGVGAVLRDDSRIIQFPARRRLAEDGEPRVPLRRPPPLEDKTEVVTSQERVRVRADMLDQMVNNAGEVSIYRARLEQQAKTFGFNLEELGQTIERLRNQLRDLDTETEAQILSRFERENDGEVPEGFDPLEMDRYSTIQQLSRALSETVNDLSSLGVSLAEMNRDSETLLVQQERVTNDLQDGLLRTRMVPVNSQTARLQRVVRQTSHSLGKQAELEISGGGGEMDRAILERIMAPLEHLLRNAVAHGIEPPEERVAAGKPEQGKVTLLMAREGSDVVLTVSDDGRGFDRDAIREKALQRGLIEADAEIDDVDLDLLILEAGFSTADEVSQIAGRGVGMDVVLSEVKQLGGSLELDSQPGRGSSFSIRLPFTLAITESLLVTAGEEVYAVPHSAMDGVVRISRADIEACYRGERETFSYGGRDYLVRYLGSMLSEARPVLNEGERWYPLLLVRSGEHRVAIHVDSLLGNRQIVVKSVGAQLSTVRWFTGGTILADGRIALILDINSLVRMDSAQHAPLLAEDQRAEDSAGVKVMVVDDSITVRKVTTRLLERHNMQVITARDGVDAVSILQEERPDMMLLDIEMPRMDGFELARHMRSTEELKNIPIIMITSRTGEKHRAHATELGVKRYLGKPYQEAELLENIYTVLAEHGND